MEANGHFINHLPGCRQGTILAPLAARRLLPGSRATGLETFWLSRGNHPRRAVGCERACADERADGAWAMRRPGARPGDSVNTPPRGATAKCHRLRVRVNERANERCVGDEEAGREAR